MTLDVKHSYVVTAVDNAAYEISKDEWNASHDFQMTVADRLLGAITTGSAVEITCTAAGRALIDDADAAAQRTTLAVSPDRNLGLAFSVAGSALTIELKTAAGSDPSSSSPVLLRFGSATATTGTVDTIAVTAATTLTVPSTATLGVPADSPTRAFRLWVVAFNDSGTVRLGVILPLNAKKVQWDTGSGRAIGVYNSSLTSNFRGWRIQSATSISTAADSFQVFYANATVTSKPFVILGWASWETGMSTAGTWGSTPTRAHVWQPGDPLPGDVVQHHRVFSTTAVSGSPLSSYTLIGSTISLGPSSNCNLVRVRMTGTGIVFGANTALYGVITRGSTSNLVGPEFEVFSLSIQTGNSFRIHTLDYPENTTVTYQLAVREVGTTVTADLRGGAYEFVAEEIMG